MIEENKEQIFCITHKFGPVDPNNEQKKEHENNSCIWEKYNPFRPNQPIFTGMFAGRMNEIERLDELLFQTKESNPSNMLIQFALNDFENIQICRPTRPAIQKF